MDAERALKVLMRAITPSILGAHRVRASFTAGELDEALAWLNSNEPKTGLAASLRDDGAQVVVDDVARVTRPVATRKGRKR